MLRPFQNPIKSWFAIDVYFFCGGGNLPMFGTEICWASVGKKNTKIDLMR